MGNLHLLDDFRGMLPNRKKSQKPTYFDRRELMQILSVYSQRVSSGEWRDYAIDHHPGVAVFSIFRHTCEQPVYAVAKSAGTGPKAARQTIYQVFSGRQRVARSSNLKDALQIFERKLRVIS